jgi:Asp-tRNA(Asn)/Glu-tRNA(Gln) amidotransferase A subunit family amidase
VVREHFTDGLSHDVRGAIESSLEVFRSMGASVEEITLPHTEYSVATYYLIAPSEASSNLARYDGIHYGHRAARFENLVDLYCQSRGEGLGEEVKRRVMLGTYALSQGYYDAYYLKALKVRRLIRQDFDHAFETVDVVVGPTTPTRCTSTTSTPSAPTWPGCRASRFPPDSPQSSCPSGCNCWLPRCRNPDCCEPPGCTNLGPSGIVAARPV